MTVNTRSPLAFGAQYDVVSRLSVADEASLRAVTADDPADVKSRYLQLPRTITDRTRELPPS